MFSMSGLSGFPFLILVVGCFCKTINIECEITNLGGKCGTNKLKLADEESPYACKAEVVWDLKSPSPKAAAPAPEEIKSRYYTFSQSQINTSLALELNWTMSEEKFATSTDKSFIVYLARTGAEEKTIYVQVNDSFVQDRNNFQNPELNFILHYCDGEDGAYMEPGCRYYMTVMTLPNYLLWTDVIKQDTVVEIPDCYSEKMEFVCKGMGMDYYTYPLYGEEYNYNGEILDKTTNSTPTANGLIVGMSILSVVIIVTILTGFICIRKRICIGKGQESGKQTILLLMNQTHEDKSYQDSANNLATILQKSNRVNVIFNMWDTSLSVANPTDWLANKLQSSHQVVFLCTPRGNDNLTRNQNKIETIQDSFIIGVKLAKQICLNSNCDKKITCVYFKPQDINCIPTFYNLSKVKVFCLANKFKKLYLHVTGDKVAADIDTHNMFVNAFENHCKNDNDRINLLLTV
uniref:Uncharacterized protein LOC100183544 n=1 Tax=Phallusia mammillata TaxID=59560 RepID=A0A6F9DHB9_9ASCI|nr:uncharacterized protein LOC100183544 [Phallusia mammillata]